MRYWKDGVFKDVKADYYTTIPDEETLNQFILDEERRSGFTVYCEPVKAGDYDLVLFSRIPVTVPDRELLQLPVFTTREAKQHESKH